MRHKEDGMYHVGLREQMSRADLWNQPAGPACAMPGPPKAGGPAPVDLYTAQFGRRAATGQQLDPGDARPADRLWETKPTHRHRHVVGANLVD